MSDLKQDFNSTTPVAAPAFDLLNDPMHFYLAYEGTVNAVEKTLRSMALNPEPPSFDNTIAPYDITFHEWKRLSLVLHTVNSCAPNENSTNLLQTARGIYFDQPKIFERIKTVYDARNTLRLNGVQMRLLEKTYDDYVRRGFLLAPKEQARLMRVQERLLKAQQNFGQNLLHAKAAYRKVIEKEEDLAGLPQRSKDFYRDAAEKAGMPGKWLIGLSPFPTDIFNYSANRALRQEVSEAMSRVVTEPPYDNRPVIKEIVGLRHEQARLLGKKNYAELVAHGRMLDTPKKIMKFITESEKANEPAALAHMEELKDFARETDGIDKLEVWDIAYYHNKLCDQRYAFDPESMRPYLEFERVITGVFKHAEKLFNISFTEVKDKYPVHHPDVRVFEINDKDGRLVGLFYGDYFARPGSGKREGSYAMSLQFGDGNGHVPAALNVLELPQYGDGRKTYLSLSNVKYIAHELGHALQFILPKTDYAALAGDHIEIDGIEICSQLMEKWMTRKDVLDTFAVDDDGKPLPQELFDKMTASANVGKAFAQMQNLLISRYDMAWHMTDPDKINSVEELEKSVRDTVPFYAVLQGLDSPRNQHVFANCYAASYFSYPWNNALCDTIFKLFEQDPYQPDSKAALQRFYAGGGAKPMAKQFEEMMGFAPDPKKLFCQTARKMTKKSKPASAAQRARSAPRSSHP